MLKKVVVIYDDTEKPNKQVKNITGSKSFGETIYKRKTLKERMQEEVLNHKDVIAFYWLGITMTMEDIYRELINLPEDIAVIHLYSRYGLKDSAQLSVTLKKAQYVKENYKIMCDDQIAMGIFMNKQEYLDCLIKVQDNITGIRPDMMNLFETIPVSLFVDLGNENQFLTFITGGFDARFFNALSGDEYTVTKSSTNKKKLKAEHDFYYLLPDVMKMWFAMPFGYREDKERAYYTMERYHMSDIAIRYVHGAITMSEFEDILGKLFYFIKNRQAKKITKEEYAKLCKDLYVNKLDERIQMLKQNEKFQVFDAFVREGTEFAGMDGIIQYYKQLYEKVMGSEKHKYESVIGHGDLCFSNILYNYEASIIRLIDPKGAISEEELWTNPYYDIAKLSHSICGSYDFFNSGLFEIVLEKNLKFCVRIDADNTEYINKFKEYLQDNGYSYHLIRLLEASLFLSMLPLHVDQENKVFGFILNAITILKEVEACLTD